MSSEDEPARCGRTSLSIRCDSSRYNGAVAPPNAKGGALLRRLS
jgi:hypothetical protein